MSALLDVVGLSVGRQGKIVLADVGFSAGPAERIAIIGPNGAGKSTLLRAIAGRLQAQGKVTITGVPEWDRAARARALAYLPQERIFHWPMRVRDVIALGRIPHGWRGGAFSATDETAVARAIADLDLSLFENRTVEKLSGGEQARVALARALAVEAPILLADEPVAALDARHQLAALGALKRRAETGTLVITVLHDLTLAARWATRILLLDSGRLAADGAPGAVLTAEQLETVYEVAFDIGEAPGGMTVLARDEIK